MTDLSRGNQEKPGGLNVLAVVQARMGSHRLPGKVMRPLLGLPMVEHVVRRAASISGVRQTVLATTDSRLDDCLAEWAQTSGTAVYRGNENDVLERFVQAALPYRPDAVVRVTADCPLLDPRVCESVLGAFSKAWPAIDYAVNVGFPRGLDTEVISMKALQRANADATRDDEREHVTLHIYRRPEAYRLIEIGTGGPDLSGLRWTVDTEEDFAFVSAIFDRLGHSDFSWRDVLDLLTRHPELADINQCVRQKEV